MDHARSMKRYLERNDEMPRWPSHPVAVLAASKVKPLTRRSFGPTLPSAVRGAHKKAIGTKETVKP